MKVLSKLEVSPGTEASHIITLTFKDKSAAESSRIVNAIANAFIQQQRKTVGKKDEVKFVEAIRTETELLSKTRERLYALTTELEAPTIEDAIVKHTTEITTLEQRRDAFLIAQKLLNDGYAPFDRSLPLESPQISGDIEREYFNEVMRFRELGSKIQSEDSKFYERLRVQAEDHLKERRAKAIENDKKVVEAMIARISEEIDRLKAETTIQRISPEYVKLKTDETVIVQRVTQAEQDLIEVREYNKALDNENVAESIALWQAAQVPPFPVPQHRGLKLVVVIALGIFAGCAVALFRHQVLPKPLRRARPRRDQDLDVPLIIMPDKHKEEVEKDIRLDISFPTTESDEAVRPRRGPR
jgi:capsular polysaccharide biosynthesis protein